MEGPLPEVGESALLDERLVRETLAGDHRAFAHLVGAHHRRVFRFLLQMIRQRQDAEDLTQQTFLKAFDHLDRFQAGRPLINWLLAIARNNALNHFRTVRPWEPMPDHLPSVECPPDRAAQERDQSENLWEQARALLPRLQFEVLWLRFGEDLSVKEAAQVAGLSQTYVKILVFRARRALLKANLRP